MIDIEISRKYNLVSYGNKGIEAQKDNKQLKIFNRFKTVDENWNDAVLWCEKYYSREERIKAKLEELQTYKKQPLATIDVIFRLEYEFQQIYNEIFETPFQVVG